ncbi:MAG: hypothetical protein NDJ94_16635 [Vicinamibacteria bacterium]|nr:hypothetical protein [Vicinamibacteria bacterium]
MKTLMLAGLALGAAFTSSAQEASDPKALEVMAQARQALGGDKLAAVQALSLEGTLRRLMGSGPDAPEMSGEVELTARADRYLRLETLTPMPGLPGITIGFGFDGTAAWSGRVGSAQASGGGHVMFVRTGSDRPGDEERTRKRVATDHARFLLATLATAPAGTSLRFAYAGQAEAPDGKAHVIDVSGPDDLALRLFVDQATSRPLMMSFKEVRPQMVVRRMGPGEAPPAQPPAEATAAAPIPEPVEVQLALGEWKAVDGVQLPHRFTKQVGGEVVEEWEITKVKLNPALKPDHFKKRS